MLLRTLAVSWLTAALLPAAGVASVHEEPAEVIWTSHSADLGSIRDHAWLDDAVLLLERNGSSGRLWRVDLPALQPELLFEGDVQRLAAASAHIIVAGRDAVQVLDGDGNLQWNATAQAPRDLVAQDHTAAWLEGRGDLHVMRMDLTTGEVVQTTSMPGPRSLPTVNSRFIIWEESPPQLLQGVPVPVVAGTTSGDASVDATVAGPGAAHPSTFDLWMYHHGTGNVFPLDQRPFAQRFPALDTGSKAVYISEDGGQYADIAIVDVADTRGPTVLAADLTNPVMLHFDGERILAVTGFGRDSTLQRWQPDGTPIDAVVVGDTLGLSTQGGIAATRNVDSEGRIGVSLLRLPHDAALHIENDAATGCWHVTGASPRIWVVSGDQVSTRTVPATVCGADGVRAWDPSGLGPMVALDDEPRQESAATGMVTAICALVAVLVGRRGGGCQKPYR